MSRLDTHPYRWRPASLLRLALQRHHNMRFAHIINVGRRPTPRCSEKRPTPRRQNAKSRRQKREKREIATPESRKTGKSRQTIGNRDARKPENWKSRRQKREKRRKTYNRDARRSLVRSLIRSLVRSLIRSLIRLYSACGASKWGANMVFLLSLQRGAKTVFLKMSQILKIVQNLVFRKANTVLVKATF